MTNEKFTTAADTFTKNVNDTMKWLQEATTTVLETQTKQMKAASDVYNKAMSTAWENLNQDNFKNVFGVSETMAGIFQKNIETIANLSKTTMKTAMEFGKQSDTEKFSNETLTKIADAYKTQIEDITSFNKKSFETITKQFTTTTNEAWWTTSSEKFKTELEKTVESSKEKVKETIDWYNKLSTPTLDTNKELFDKLNKQINTGLTDNQKLWSEYMNAYSAKFSEVKTPADFLKETWTATSKKKQTATSNN